MLAKEISIPLVFMGASSMAGASRRLAGIVEDTLTWQRVYLLEQRVKAAQLDFEWNRVQ